MASRLDKHGIQLTTGGNVLDVLKQWKAWNLEGVQGGAYGWCSSTARRPGGDPWTRWPPPSTGWAWSSPRYGHLAAGFVVGVALAAAVAVLIGAFSLRVKTIFFAMTILVVFFFPRGVIGTVRDALAARRSRA